MGCQSGEAREVALHLGRGSGCFDSCPRPAPHCPPSPPSPISQAKGGKRKKRKRRGRGAIGFRHAVKQTCFYVPVLADADVPSWRGRRKSRPSKALPRRVWPRFTQSALPDGPHFPTMASTEVELGKWTMFFAFTRSRKQLGRNAWLRVPWNFCLHHGRGINHASHPHKLHSPSQ